MPHIRALFKNEPELSIVAANVRDGERLALHDRAFFDLFARKLRDRLLVKFPDNVFNCEDYLVELKDLAFGADQEGSDWILQATTPAPSDDPDWYTTVLKVAHWELYIGDHEFERMRKAAGVKLPWKALGAGANLDTIKLLRRLRQGDFAPTREFALGYPIAWLTPRPAFEARKRAAASLADFARDFLGLIHHKTGQHLIALHVPASAVAQVATARPTFADAGRHRRFMAAAAGDPPPYQHAWGQTLDLDAFQDTGELADGAAERVCARIDTTHLGGKSLQFEYLGRVVHTRGSFSATDGDFADRQRKRDDTGHDAVVARV